MTRIEFVPGGRSKLAVQFRQRRVIHGNGRAAVLADQVMVVLFGQFIDQLAVAHVRRQREAVLCQELERAIHGRFGETGLGAPRLFVDLGRREVSAVIAQRVQDRHPLGSDAKAARVQLVGEIGAARHGFPYCEKSQ